jgi:hypothetical protein
MSDCLTNARSLVSQAGSLTTGCVLVSLLNDLLRSIILLLLLWLLFLGKSNAKLLRKWGHKDKVRNAIKNPPHWGEKNTQGEGLSGRRCSFLESVIGWNECGSRE